MDIILDLALLRAVRAIAASRSLTAAAAELHSSQSALSHLIGKWERQTGILLFDRRRRPLEPTAAGALLAEQAERLHQLLDDTTSALRALQASEQKRLLITLECHTCIEWLAPTLDRYRRDHPSVHLDLRMGASFDPLPTLKSGSTDLVITAEHDPSAGSRPSSTLSADPLFRYPIVALVRRDHPLANIPALKPKDFAGETVITYPVAECRLDLYTRFLDPAGVVPKERRTAELTTMIIQWVTGGVGIAALPQWAIPSGHPDLAMVPLGTGGLWADLYAVRRRSDRDAAHIDAFIENAKQESFASLDSIERIPE